MCMVEGILSCDIWQKKKAGEESKPLKLHKLEIETTLNVFFLFEKNVQFLLFFSSLQCLLLGSI